MLEAMLFGYERGAFTARTRAHAGKFEQAQDGTLLLMKSPRCRCRCSQAVAGSCRSARWNALARAQW